MKTAPKTGLILLWDEDSGHPVVANWSENHQCYVEQFGGRDPGPDVDIVGCKVYLPTHWTELPAQPAQKEEQ